MALQVNVAVICEVPDDYKSEIWPWAMACRPEVGDVVRSIEKTELKVAAIKHAVRQEEREGEKQHFPYLIVVLQK
jgi:hypothetical protein